MNATGWSPVARVAAVMQDADVWWAVAGGWAIDLWLGRRTREHHDVEVVARRDEQARVHDTLHVDCELLCIDPPGSAWRPWARDAPITSPAFQCKARSRTDEFDVFLALHGQIGRREARARLRGDRSEARRRVALLAPARPPDLRSRAPLARPARALNASGVDVSLRW